jgi:hypothetical protein
MLAFTSWSFVHDITPGSEVIYIDPARVVPVHETLVSARDQRTFEIDFGDYAEVEPSQWAPRSIRIESKDYFACAYRFQLVGERHWMLEEVVSWFKPDDRSRGVVEDVRIDAGQARVDETKRQLEAARALFGGAGEPDRRIEVATVPFTLGRAISCGPYEVRVALGDDRNILVSAATNDPAAPDAVPLCFLDDKQRLIFAATVKLRANDGARRGTASLRGARPWRTVRSIAMPARTADSLPVGVHVVPVRWGETIAVNIPDATPDDQVRIGSKPPQVPLTRAWQMRLDRTDQGTAKLTLDLVSVDGPREFVLEVAGALLGESGALIACGQLSTSLRVVSEPVERRFEVDLGKIDGGAEPRYVVIGIARGEVIAAPMGSRWGMYMRSEQPFEVAALLAAPDDTCRRLGLDDLGDRQFESTVHVEFLEDRYDERRLGDGPLSRRTLLRPHSEALGRILAEAGPADVRAAAARLLAYSEAEVAAAALDAHAADAAPTVREAAIIGLTFLGRREHLAALRAALARTAPPRDDTSRAGGAAWRAFDRCERDILIALARQGSDDAVDLLGATLVADLETVRPQTDRQGQTRLNGRVERALEICTLLGRATNPRAAHWLISAADLIERRSVLAEHFDRSALARSMLQFKKQTRDRIIAELEKGDPAGVWTYAIQDSGDPTFIKVIRSMFHRNGLNAGAVHSAVRYLWNVDAPEAVDGLRDAYDRGLMRDEPRLWLGLCEALAARGDGRGLADALKALVELERPAEPPKEDQPRREWEHQRSARLSQAEAVFSRASKQVLADFLVRKTDATAPEERRVVLQLLWKLPDLPTPFIRTISRWAEDADQRVAELAKRLRDRD